jgi:hypothetical protein
VEDVEEPAPALGVVDQARRHSALFPDRVPDSSHLVALRVWALQKPTVASNHFARLVARGAGAEGSHGAGCVQRSQLSSGKAVRVRCSRHAPGESVEPVAGVYDGAVLAACAGHLWVGVSQHTGSPALPTPASARVWRACVTYHEVELELLRLDRRRQVGVHCRHKRHAEPDLQPRAPRCVTSAVGDADWLARD